MNLLKRRAVYFLAMALSVVAGLLARKYYFLFPAFTYAYLGDIIWGFAVYFLSAFLFPQIKPLKLGVYAFIFSAAVELSQLYQAPWIDAVRASKIGGLLLGHGFLWSDVACYFAGIFAGACAVIVFMKYIKNSAN
jgi:hypothetical protein